MTEPNFEEKFHLVLLNDVDAHHFEYEELDDLIIKLQEYVDTDVTVFIFKGTRYYTTQGNLKYLIVNKGKKIPLFSEDDSLQIDESGWLGR